MPFPRGHAAALSPGLHIATKKLLRLGIILFGLSITLQQILGLGWSVVFLDVLVITLQETPPTTNRKLHGGDSYAP